jgi:LysR family transcriptional activator of nhaA
VPTVNAALRRALDGWFEKEGQRPRLAGEFEDSALMKVFGQGTSAVFPAPAAIAADVCRLYSVRGIGVRSPRAIRRDLRRAAAETPRSAGHHERRAP